MFPVPLNSSKMTSSIRLPVSTRAVAMMVRLPPSSIFRAEPKNFLGFVQCIGIDAAAQDLARGRDDGIVGPGQPGHAVEQDGTSRLISTSLLAFSSTILATWAFRAGGSSNVEATTSPLTVLGSP